MGVATHIYLKTRRHPIRPALRTYYEGEGYPTIHMIEAGPCPHSLEPTMSMIKVTRSQARIKPNQCYFSVRSVS